LKRGAARGGGVMKKTCLQKVAGIPNQEETKSLRRRKNDEESRKEESMARFASVTG